jgi:membrane protein YdbS with pleckstrin-like domain
MEEHLITGIADGAERSLDPNSIAAERITRGVAAAILSGGSFFGLLPLHFTLSMGLPLRLLLLGGWALFSLLVALWAIFWPPVRYRHTSYRVDSQGVRIKSGVIWRSVVSVPQSRVQHTDVSQGPIERSLGLATLIIHTAGTQHASISLGGLSREIAAEIRDYLIDADEQDAV